MTDAAPPAVPQPAWAPPAPPAPPPPGPGGAGGVFYKAPKPGQDRRIDLPTLGPATIEAAARAGRPVPLMAESDLNDPRLVLPRSAGGLGLAARRVWRRRAP